MAEYHSDDCGSTRKYVFRRIKTPKIKFSVKAPRDAAICLSPDDSEQPEDMYEVFIGCWGGDESGIRRGKEDDVVKVDTPGVLSDEEHRGFWITMRRGTIRVGRQGELTPFMVYQDPRRLLHVAYYGFSTGYGAEGDWIFPDGDGEDDGSSSSSSSESEVSSSDSEAEELNTMETRPIQYKRPARWVPGHGGYLPHRPVCGGEGAHGPVYVGMAEHDGRYILGMIVPSEGVCYVPHDGEAIAKETYYVLGNPGAVTMCWVGASGGYVPSGALEGGRGEDGETLFIGRVMVDGVVSCGKVVPSRGVCLVPYGGAE
ncbi:uncharacterized protein LOC108666006, partial [Hyalella azteca]|uniref:Uncharacterized protein LOC108666006 n=1 Tax=Hyalella azteca TaxID=294128 RepID=A0A8B7N4V2_HYAAZ